MCPKCPENGSVYGRPLKGTVPRKLRWVKSGINQQLFDCQLAADVFFSNLKGHHCFTFDKTGFSG
jgi:hypothetical protein